MKIILAGYNPGLVMPDTDFRACKYALQSFYTVSDSTMELMKKAEFLMIDSGAFTFIEDAKKGGQKSRIDFDEYADRYIEFINKWDVKHFIELDLDDIVGMEEVERLRKKIEDGTGKKCIPAWHINRGADYYVEMCKNYDYVALGGFVSGQIKPKDYKYLNWFIDTAHKYDAQVHILGITDMKALQKYHFDSADSTRWIGGGRFGELFYFDGEKIVQHKAGAGKLKPEINYKMINSHNFIEWCKFQEYADAHF